MRAALLCFALALAGDAIAAESAASQPPPPIGATSPDKAKAEHAADKASNPKPLASQPEMATFAPQADSSQQGTSAAQAPSHAASAQESGLVDHWLTKFSEDPVVTFTVVLAISTILLWWETRGLRLAAKGQAKDTKDALTIARDAADAAKQSADLAVSEFSASHRAWVRVDAGLDTQAQSSPAKFDQSGLYVALIFNLKNFGSVPATNVDIHVRLVATSDTDSLLERQRALCRECQEYPQAGFTLFPGEPLEVKVSNANLPQSEVEANQYRFPKQQAPVISAYVVGCIDYQSAAGPERHQSGFAYWICATHTNDGDVAFVGNMLPVEIGPVLVNNLRFGKMADGQFFFAT